MIKQLSTLCFLLLATVSLGQQTPKAVFIILDGIPADVIEKLQPPCLMEISKQGGYTRSYTGGVAGSYNVTSTISAPGYNNLITGVWGNKHNVWDNDIAEPNYNYWNIFRIVENHKPSLSTAIFSTWTDNRTKLVGEGLPEAGGIKLDYAFDGLELDTVQYPKDKSASHIRKIDEDVATEAARYIRDRGPDLSWVYLEYTDDMGHRFGDSPQLHDAVIKADRLVRKIWESVLFREGTSNEQWIVVITTDHGRDAATGKNHGGQSERERATWIVTNARNLNSHFKETPSVVDILPSICNHLSVAIPDDVRTELDGTPFVGIHDFSDLRAVRNGNKIIVEWKPHTSRGDDVEVLIAVTNNFRKGDPDSYVCVG